MTAHEAILAERTPLQRARMINRFSELRRALGP